MQPMKYQLAGEVLMELLMKLQGQDFYMNIRINGCETGGRKVAGYKLPANCVSYC